MIKLLHTADLHIAESETEYSLKVLDEIVTIASKEQVDAVLLVGDIFNDFNSFSKMKLDLERAFKEINSRVLYITGNHESLKKGKGEIDSRGFSKVEFFYEEDLSLVKNILLKKADTAVEIIPIPFQKQATGFERLKLPAKNFPRIAMLHGSVPEILSFTGISEEEDDSLIDFTAITSNGIDFAALGHIHARQEHKYAGVVCSYPGSPRVWRRGEYGKRSLNIIEVNGEQIITRKIEIKSAGQFYEVILPFNFVPPDLSELEQYEKNDSVKIELSGYAANEKIVADCVSAIQQKLAGKVRILEIANEDVIILPDIMENKSVKAFLEEWKKRKPEEEEKIPAWLKARDVFIEVVKDMVV